MKIAYNDVKRGEKRYEGRRAMEMKVQERRKRGMTKRGWLDRLRDAIKEQGLSGEKAYKRSATRRISSYIDPP